MRVVHHLSEARPTRGASGATSYLTIGVFDGLHLGHQKIIGGLVSDAHGHGSEAVAITFDPHPAAILREDPPQLLTTVGERLDLMADLALDTAVVYPFTQEVVRTTARQFMDDLTRHLALDEVRVGPDFTLGRGRQGNISRLRRLGTELGFRVKVIEPVTWGGAVVRSSRIRDALKQGNVDEATGCLGRPYRLSGVVVPGRGLGRDIGVPTANIASPPKRLIPAGGVYACRARTERWGDFPAAVNVGTRPTFTVESDLGGPTVEAHLLDFDRDLYDQVLSIDFLARLRDERAYPTLNALVAQMRKDIKRTRALVEP